MSEATDTPPAGFVLIGHLGRSFQLEGGLNFVAVGEREQLAIEEVEEVFVAGVGVRAVERVRRLSGRTVVYLSGVERIEAAKALVNRPVYAAASSLRIVEETTSHDLLVGRQVTVDGARFGQVVAVMEASGHGLLLVDHQGETVLLPMEADYVEVGSDEVRVVDPPEGLLTLHKRPS